MDFIVENNIIKSKDLTFDENVGGIGTVLFKHLKKYGTRIAQIEADSGKFDTFASLLEKCIRTAIALKQRGIRKEDFVCLSSDHHLNACVPIVAATFLGAVPFSLEPSLSIPDRSELLKQIQPKILFLRKSCEASFKESCKLAEVLVDTVIFEDSFEEEFLSPKSTEEEFNPVHIKDLKETAIIYFSSGSAGLPKPVCLNHYSLIARYSDIADGKISFITGKKSENGVMLSFSNWHWISSGWVLVCCTVDGVCRLLSNHFDPLEVWHYIHQYKVVDPETGKPLGCNQPGELRVKTKMIMNGYYNRDSSSCFDEDGYFKTGDMVYYDEDYCFYFVQRLKELLKCRGWQVYPVKLENILLQHHAVKNAVVIGKPHKVDGEHPLGVVILKEKCQVTEEELLKFVNNFVEERQQLRGGIKFVQTFPLGVTGKLDRNALKKIMLKN